MKKLIRITTVPISLEKLLENQLRFMSNHYDVTAVSSDHERLEELGKTQGVATYCVMMTRKITPLQDLKAVFKLYSFFRKEKPFIVHSHTPKAGIVGMMAAKFSGVPHRLHTVAGLPLLEATGSKRKLLDFIEKLTYKFATNVYPNSHGLYDIIIENNFITKDKLKVLGNGSSNGIDVEYFDPILFDNEQQRDVRTDLKISQDDFVYIFVGRLVSDKGINELVTAYKRINLEIKNTKLLLVGPLEPELDPLSDDTLNEIANNKSIIEVGYQKDIRSFLAISDVLVFPSYREGFPNVVLQAGSMGLPAIVSNINGCNEIITENVNGLIIEVKNANAVYKAMKRIVLDDSLKESLKRNARIEIVEKYQQSKVWHAILNEYRKLENNV